MAVAENDDDDDDDAKSPVCVAAQHQIKTEKRTRSSLKNVPDKNESYQIEAEKQTIRQNLPVGG